ncbi:MAG: hypothetical protein NTU47_16280 [Ignavibacteriales bacterium]|nr:hypothetical protein [Ignavibacteriales bacterium]
MNCELIGLLQKCFRFEFRSLNCQRGAALVFPVCEDQQSREPFSRAKLLPVPLITIQMNVPVIEKIIFGGPFGTAHRAAFEIALEQHASFHRSHYRLFNEKILDVNLVKARANGIVVQDAPFLGKNGIRRCESGLRREERWLTSAI